MPTKPDIPQPNALESPPPSAIGTRLHKSLRIVAHWFSLVDPGPLAEPWRRLVAAVLDVVVIAVVHVIVLGALYGTGRNADSFPVLWRVVSPLFCWVYVLLGWSSAATPGMRCVGIRLARVDGRRIWLDTALLRVVGFVAASLPAKLGLLPILTDVRRQGWHDRIAGTIVVRRGVDLAALPVRAVGARRFVMRPPDLSAPRFGWPIVLAAYAALSVALTWPVGLHMMDRLAGPDGDKYVFVWNAWFVRNALAHHLPLLTTDLLFTPHVAPLVFHTMDWFDCFLAIPLTALFGQIAAYNLLLLGSLTASAFSAYWLVGSLTRCRPAAIVAGIIFGFSPFFLSQALVHLNVVSAEFLPLFALLFYDAVTTRRARWAFGAGVALALAGYCDLQFLLFDTLIAFAILIAALQSQHRPPATKSASTILLPSSREEGVPAPRGEGGSTILLPSSREEGVPAPRGEGGSLSGEGGSNLVLLCAVTIGVAVVALSPLLVPAALESHSEGYMNKSTSAGAFSADFADYDSLSPLSSIGRGRTHGTTLATMNYERIVTPGLAALLLGVVGLWRMRRQTLAWRIGLICAVVLSFGPALTFWELSPPTFVSILLLGFPGMGFSPPWNTDGLVKSLESLLSNPGDWLSMTQTMAMPLPIVSAVVPMMQAFRTPSRFAIVVALCLAIGVGYALKECLALLRSRPILRVAFITIVAALILVEYTAIPFPNKTLPYSAFDRWMGADPTDYTVIDVPFNASGQYQYAQTFHHKRLFRGFLARCPAETRSLCRSNDLLFYFDGFPTLPRTRAPALAAGLKQLQGYGARYIIVHKGQIDGRRAAQLNTLLSRLGCRRVWRDSQVDVYRTYASLKSRPPEVRDGGGDRLSGLSSLICAHGSIGYE